MNIEEALQKKIWAVVGATPKQEKFGYKVYVHLKQHGYEVYPVHPTAKEVDGDRCYRSLEELPVVPEVIDLIVPESAGLATLEDCHKLGISTVWMQPGADTEAVLQKANDLHLQTIQACVLVELK